MLKIVNLHGFMGKADNRNHQALCQLTSENNVISPQIDYLHESPSEILRRLCALAERESCNILFVGQSLGGFYANILSQKYQMPCLLTNPCLMPHTCDVIRESELSPDILTEYAECADLANNPNAYILCSRKDKIIPGNLAMCLKITPHVTEVKGSHSNISNLTEQLDRTLKGIPGIGYGTKILVKSACGALRYVMRHYPEPGVTEYPDTIDDYAAISIQDTIGNGFGFQLTENQYCKGVLTLYFDDIEQETKGLKLMDREQAAQIIDFIQKHQGVSTLLIHCFAGISRSKAVGAFAAKLLGYDEKAYLEDGFANMYVYEMLERVYDQ